MQQSIKFFVQRRKNGKEADDGIANYNYIHEVFCNNLIKMSKWIP